MEAAGGKVKGEKEEARERWFFDMGHRFVRGVRAWLCSFFKKLARALPPPLEIISETLGPAERFTHDPSGVPLGSFIRKYYELTRSVNQPHRYQ